MSQDFPKVTVVLINGTHSLSSGITESCLLSTCDEWASPVYRLSSLSARPVGTSHPHSTDTCRYVSYSSQWCSCHAGLHTQQPTQTGGGGWPAPTHAPVCTCPSHRPHESVRPINYHEGPYIRKDIQDQADRLHFNSILYTYLKNTTSYNTE